MAKTKKVQPDDEVIADFDERMASGRDLEGFERVRGSVSRKLSMVYSLRLSPEEYRLFEEAADAKGMALSDFLRAAARAAAEGEIDAGKAAALAAVRDKVRELDEALSRV